MPTVMPKAGIWKHKSKTPERCPLRSLPIDSDQLQAIPSMDYASPVIPAADADQSVLFALCSLSLESSTEDMG
ncbi:hypothetical protein [Sodalis sp.]|uniref:hypothetical protein n=1 Tax=Sodalis sp. (in: enterobacteria) TaxID=1898979 RepID=UPI0038731A46